MWKKIWPWSKIKALQFELDANRKWADELLSVIHEIDPGYWHRKSLEVAMSSPRMNAIITGINVPN